MSNPLLMVPDEKTALGNLTSKKPLDEGTASEGLNRTIKTFFRPLLERKFLIQVAAGSLLVFSRLVMKNSLTVAAEVSSLNSKGKIFDAPG